MSLNRISRWLSFEQITMGRGVPRFPGGGRKIEISPLSANRRPSKLWTWLLFYFSVLVILHTDFAAFGDKFLKMMTWYFFCFLFFFCGLFTLILPPAPRRVPLGSRVTTPPLLGTLRSRSNWLVNCFMRWFIRIITNLGGLNDFNKWRDTKPEDSFPKFVNGFYNFSFEHNRVGVLV